MERTVRVSHFARSAGITNDGVQSHCGTLASNTRGFHKHDVTTGYFLLLRRVYTAGCAKDIGDETCHSTQILQMRNATTVFYGRRMQR